MTAIEPSTFARLGSKVPAAADALPRHGPTEVEEFRRWKSDDARHSRLAPP